MTKKIMVTGVNGFIGCTLCKTLSQKKFTVNGILRSPNTAGSQSIAGINYLSVGDIGAQTDWSTTLLGMNCVIHTAARAHIMNENKADALAAYRSINVEGTRNLAKQAANAGVSRFVYLSSIKVNGEQTFFGNRFCSGDDAFPEDAHGISKWEAEQALHEVSASTAMEVVIIRPPLVYGPGVKGNFLSMLRWLNRGIPLPLGSIHNQRSLVGIDNLVDIIINCIDNPEAANKTFLVSDGEDLSTTELLLRLGTALNKSTRLLPVTASVLEITAQLFGKKAVTRRLLGNLQVDISKTKEVLNWSPPVSVDEGLQKTADWFLIKR